MPRKNVLERYKALDQADMSAPITSPIVGIQFMDNLTIQMVYTGAPNGTFAVEVSDNYDPVTNDPGTWSALPMTGTPTATGTADDVMIDLNQLSFMYLRVTYTPTSGTGALDMWVSGKEI